VILFFNLGDIALESIFVIVRRPPASPERAQARDGGQAEGDAAISLFPMYFEVAPVLPPPRESLAVTL
jgi:hypothetical protein